jgi:hypothetical protein
LIGLQKIAILDDVIVLFAADGSADIDQQGGRLAMPGSQVWARVSPPICPVKQPQCSRRPWVSQVK